MKIFQETRGQLEEAVQALSGDVAVSRTATTASATETTTLEPVEQGSSAELFESLLEGDEVDPEEIMVELNIGIDEFLVELVSRMDGCANQRDVVELTGWSKAKVSRKLSRLEAEERVDRLQIGREKIVYLPGSEPTQLDGPRR